MDKNPEIAILLQILKGGADQQISAPRFNSSYLVKLAEQHKVVYALLLFAQQRPELFTPEQISKLDNRCRQGAQRSLTQLHELKRVAGTLNDKGIGYVCIKGPQLSRVIYGRQALKESLDLDIMLVNGGDLAKVHEMLAGLGYNRSNLNDYPRGLRRKLFLIAKREVHYFNRETRCAIDLHIRPGANTYLTGKYFKGFLSVLVTYDLDGTPLPVLPDEAYFVYLCYHGALHQFARLAWLMDIRAFLALKRDALDYAKIMTIARKIRAERSVVLAMMLLKRYFGLDFVETRFNTSPCNNRMKRAWLFINTNKHEQTHASSLPVRQTGIRQLKINFVRMKYLVSSCMHMAERDAGYGLTRMGRAGKVVYIMLLIRGMAGRIDWLYGILVRQVVKLLPGT